MAPLNAFTPPGGNISALASHSWQESSWSRCRTTYTLNIENKFVERANNEYTNSWLT